MPKNTNSKEANSNEIYVISQEPWPEQGIYNYSKIEDGDWGYLTLYSDGKFVFSKTSAPSETEILQRWGFYFSNS